MMIKGTIIEVRSHTNKADRIRVTAAYEAATIGAVAFDTEASPEWYVGRTVTITIEVMGT